MADYIITEKDNITAIADAVRQKSGKNGQMTIEQMIDEIGKGNGVIPSPIVAGDTPIILLYDLESVDSTLTPTGGVITIPFTGTYRFKYMMIRWQSSGSTYQGVLYKNGVEMPETKHSIATGDYDVFCSNDVECVAGDVIELYLRGNNSLYTNYAPFFVACIDWNNGF